MTSMLAWRDPFRQMAAVLDELDRRMSEAGGGSLPARWTPTCDVIEREDEIVISAELPGVKDADIEIKVADGVLEISGAREQSEQVSEDHFRRIERSYGSFLRRFPLPPGVNEDDISAKVAYGVLRITIPKPTAPEPRRIPIASDGG